MPTLDICSVSFILNLFGAFPTLNSGLVSLTGKAKTRFFVASFLVVVISAYPAVGEINVDCFKRFLPQNKYFHYKMSFILL